MRAFIIRLALSVFALGFAVTGANARAEDFQYDCQNEAVAIAIPGDRLDRALDQLRLTTRCPISGTKLACGKRSKPVVGMLVSEEALQQMLKGTGLQMTAIKGGFQIDRVPRR